MAFQNCFRALKVSNLQHTITGATPFMFRTTAFISSANKFYEHFTTAHSAERITVVGLLLALSSP
jgi:hypothetical protein